MSELDRKALASGVLDAEIVAELYRDGNAAITRLCESHERLRMENERLRAGLAKRKDVSDE